MYPTLSDIKSRLWKLAEKFVTGNSLLQAIEVLVAGYKEADAEVLAEAEAYTNSQITANNYLTAINNNTIPPLISPIQLLTLTVNTSTRVCTLPQNYKSGSLRVYKGGSRMTLGIDFSETTSNSFTMVATLFSNDQFIVDFQKA